MPTSGLAAYGTTFAVGDGADPEVFTTIAEVSEIGGISLERMTEDGTSFDSGGWEEHISTLRKVGDISFKLNFIPDAATHGNSSGGLVHSWTAGTVKNYKVTFPDASSTEWIIPAIVTKVNVKVSAKGKVEGDVTLKPSGTPTLA